MLSSFMLSSSYHSLHTVYSSYLSVPPTPHLQTPPPPSPFTYCFSHLTILLSVFFSLPVYLLPVSLHHPPHARLTPPPFFIHCSFSISGFLIIHLHPPTPSLCIHCSVSNGSAPSQQIHQAKARRAAEPN